MYGSDDRGVDKIKSVLPLTDTIPVRFQEESSDRKLPNTQIFLSMTPVSSETNLTSSVTTIKCFRSFTARKFVDATMLYFIP